ncbi:class I SAM-dependent methyltransferase [Undibacterium sp. JH2W]|uniref:class I SAM-dependent methyltransferase n=1 Tax=Undibacterium sp. JH2W TaxID=3413037 RepID=UPI003BF0C3BA
MNKLLLPTVPNQLLSSVEDEDRFGEMRLRENVALGFVENAAFDSSLATYDENYQTSQVHSKLFQAHMKDVLAILKAEFPRRSVLVEVGCGKGDFVELVQADAYFSASGYDFSYEGNNPFIQKRFLTPEDRIPADVVVLRHVLEHIKAPHDFLTMLRDIFGKAAIYIEVPSYDWMLDNQAFFDVTYEHVNYFSEKSLLALFDRHVLKSGRCFNGQYQYAIADLASLSGQFASLYENSAWKDLDFEQLFPSHAEKIASIEARLAPTSELYIWGAATKGCMFLVHCMNQGKLIPQVGFAIDVNPLKCGKFLPGSHVQIQSKEAFFAAAKPGDLLLIANPNYQAEIVEEIHVRDIVGVDVMCL